MENKKFPDGFLWGASTSSHQIEGGNNNDWSEWEKTPGHIKTGEVSGKAANSWEMYEKDFDLLQQMNLNAYRFSIEWSRIEPERGIFNQEALNHYKEMLVELHQRGITPVVTIHHFTNPLWLPNWSNPKVIKYFLNFVKYLVENLGELVPYWLTINEPNIYVGLGYVEGTWPPGKKNILTAYKTLRNMHKAHNKAYDLIKKIYKDKNWPMAKVSMAFNLQAFYPLNKSPITKLTTKIANYLTNDYGLMKSLGYMDFIGVNHYFTHWVKGFSWNNDPDGVVRNDLNWAVHPPGFYKVLTDIKKYNLPVLVTENGTADAEDKIRPWLVASYVTEMHKAIADGVKVFGYIHWALLDNWEWAEGFSGKYGIAETDFETLERRGRNSGKLLGEIAKNNALPGSMPEPPK